jgi:hypothetical protein
MMMEILKFSEPSRRSSAPRQRTGFKGVVGFALAVLVMGGMSTTLAGTITVGTGGTVEFGQGVVTTAACDSTIDVTPISIYETSTSGFFVGDIVVSQVGLECLDKTFTLKAYSETDQLKLNIGFTAGQEVDTVKIAIPDTSTSLSATEFANAVTAFDGITPRSNQAGESTRGTFSISTASGFTAAATANSGATGQGTFTLSNVRIPSSVVKITLESS